MENEKKWGGAKLLFSRKCFERFAILSLNSAIVYIIFNLYVIYTTQLRFERGGANHTMPTTFKRAGPWPPLPPIPTSLQGLTHS